MYQRKISFEVVTTNMDWNANGCATFSIRNAGNTNVTLMGQLVLEPGMELSGPAEHPEIQDFTQIKILFDVRNDPTSIAVAPGAEPINPQYNPGDPPPLKDNRVIIMRSILTKM
jgi:hypothetical protein